MASREPPADAAGSEVDDDGTSLATTASPLSGAAAASRREPSDGSGTSAGVSAREHGSAEAEDGAGGGHVDGGARASNGAGSGAGAGAGAAECGEAASTRARFFKPGSAGVASAPTTAVPRPVAERADAEFNVPFAISPNETALLRQLKAQVAAHPELSLPSDLRLLQFLFGRKMDVDSAVQKLEKYQAVEREWALDQVGLWAEDAIRELRTMKMYVVPPTGDAPAVMYFHAALHLPADFTTECTMRTFCYVIWRMLEHPHTVRHGFGMVYLMQDFAWKNFDLNAEKIFLDTFQDRIPLRYQNMICVSAPWYFRAILKMVKPFMKQKLRDRMKLEPDNLGIANHVPVKAIPVAFGGHNPYTAAKWVEQEVQHLQQERKKYLAGGK